MEVLIVLVILLACALMLLAVRNAWLIVVYVVENKALYTIARRRGFSAPWMAWIPFANVWLFGSVADQYQKMVNGRVSRRGKISLALKIATQAVNVLSGDFTGVIIGKALVEQLISSGGSWEETAVICLIAFAAGLIPVLAISAAYYVYSRIVCYDLYVSSKPNSAVLFLVLSILTPATPFLIYACRNSDEGLPPETQET